MDMMICLGVVIQGTKRRLYLPRRVGHHQVGLKFNKPVIFWARDCNTLEQAWDRAGGKARQ
jgi:6,7-dimethyl-8-ribityllumazine synthase